jgi:dolichol-phosphate mannosyltransferase
MSQSHRRQSTPDGDPAASSSDGPFPGRPATWGWVLAAVVAAQVVVAAVVPVLPEEAYHWNFARHLDWSYYDHPPMIAWAIALGRLLLGDTPLGVRLVPLLFGLGTAWLLGRMARRVYGEPAARWAVLLHAAQPAAFFVGGWAFPDSPLLFFWALTLTWVWRALDEGRPRWWLAAGLALGGGMLSKYTAAFLVPSVLLHLLCSRRDRRWLATPWPYLAGACSLLPFAPVLYWNWAHDWASFRFQSTARFAAANGIRLGDGAEAALQQWAYVLPLTLPLAAAALWRAARSDRPAERFMFWAFAPTAAFFFLLGWTPSFHVLWPLPAYLSLTVAMAGALAAAPGRLAHLYRACWPLLTGASVCGTVAVALHAACVLPGAPPIREVYGWAEAARRARAVHDSLPPDSFYLAVGPRSYPPPSQLAFHLGEPANVFGQNLIGREALEYRYWAEPNRLAGKDAVIVIEGGDPTGQVRQILGPFFRSVEPADDWLAPAGRFAAWPRPPLRFTVYRARGYQPPPGL